jgi:glycosyltransferase involved in cell wall biosynthesis
MIKVSVAVATYNGEIFLWEQLLSIHNQSRQPDEIIISDDNSTDKTLDIIKKFSSFTNIKVKVFKNSCNLGYAKNFEIAYNHVIGDYIFPCDQDDVWFEEKIEILLDFISNNPNYNVYVHDVILTNSELLHDNITKLKMLKESNLGVFEHGMGCATVIRGNFLKACLPFPIVMKGHDNWINTLALTTGTFAFTPDILQYYRRHDKNTSQISSNALTARKVKSLFLQFKFLNKVRLRNEIKFYQNIYKKLMYFKEKNILIYGNSELDETLIIYKIEEILTKRSRRKIMRLLRIIMWSYFIYPAYFFESRKEKQSYKDRSKKFILLSYTYEKT